MTSPTTTAAMERLEHVLNAPVPPKRHPEIVELAAQRAADGTPDGLRTKALPAAAEPESNAEAGEFVALISDFAPDRQNEKFAPGAFDNALAKIRRAGKPTPVLFGHDQRTLSAVLGMVPPDGFWTDTEGLWARGWIDTVDPVGAKLHRMLRNGALQWSIGFRLAKARPGHDGVRVLEEVDELLELSGVPVPANSRTRTAAVKADEQRPAPTMSELRERERALGLEDPELARVREETKRDIIAWMRHGSEKAAQTETRTKAARTARQHGPIHVETFEC